MSRKEGLGRNGTDAAGLFIGAAHGVTKCPGWRKIGSESKGNHVMALTIHLSEEQEAVLAARAQALGISAEEYARQVLTQEVEAEVRPRRHISEIILEHMSRVPPEIMAQMPKDGASEHDHYIYGLPKKNL